MKCLPNILPCPCHVKIRKWVQPVNVFSTPDKPGYYVPGHWETEASYDGILHAFSTEAGDGESTAVGIVEGQEGILKAIPVDLIQLLR